MNTKDREAERAAIVANDLSDAQRAVLMAASAKKPKTLATIFRHAKVDWRGYAWWEAPMLHGMVRTIPSNWIPKYVLNDFGLAVRDHLRGDGK